MLKNILKTTLKSQKGMTLIEIMVVVTIIASISGFIAVKVIDKQAEANIKLTKTGMETVSGVLDQYKLDNYRYPTTDQGLDALVSKPSTGKVPKNYPSNGYIKKKSLKDAWDEPYLYSSDGRTFTISSKGPDQEEGTDDDISSDELDEE